MFKKLLAALLASLTVSALVCGALPAFAEGETAAPADTSVPAETSAPAGSESAAAEVSLPITVDTAALDASAVSVNGAVYLPLRALAETLGYEVGWSKDTGASVVTLKKGDSTVSIDLSASNVDDNGCKYYLGEMLDLSYATELYYREDRVYLPVSVIEELLHVAVSTSKDGAAVCEVTENTVKLAAKTLEASADHLKADISYPELSGLSDEKVQKAINDAIYALAENAAKTGKANAADMKGWIDDEVASGADASSIPDTCQTSLTYRVTYNRSGLLDIVFDEYQYAGGAHGGTVRTSMLFDLATGKVVTLPELVKDYKTARAMINAGVTAYFASLKGSGLETLTPFTDVGDTPDFYLSNDGVCLFFQQYAYFPYAAGIVGVNVSYSTVAALLADKYAFLASAPKLLTSDAKNELAVGEEAYIVLDSNATTGYTWKAASDGDAVAVSEGLYIVDAHEEGMVGVGGKTIFHITAKAAGTVKLTCTYSRDWENPSKDDTTAVYEITVK